MATHPHPAMVLQAPYSPSGLTVPHGKTLLESPAHLSRPGGFSKLNLTDVEDHLSTAAPSEISSPPLCFAGTPEGQQHMALQELEACCSGDWQARTLSPPWLQDTAALAGARAEQVRKQVEYYFSHQNLSRDLYLCSRMDQLGWVDLEEIVQFPRMKRTSVTVQEAAAALMDSTRVEVSGGLQHVRRRLVPPLPPGPVAEVVDPTWAGVQWPTEAAVAAPWYMNGAGWGDLWAPTCAAPPPPSPAPFVATWAGAQVQSQPWVEPVAAPVQASTWAPAAKPTAAAPIAAAKPSARAAKEPAVGRPQRPRAQRAHRRAGGAAAAESSATAAAAPARRAAPVAPARRVAPRRAQRQSRDAAADGSNHAAARPRTPKTPSHDETPKGTPEIHTWLRWGYDA